MKLRSAALLLFLPFVLASAEAPEVEITSEPSHHLALENESVRVFKVEVAPHASTLMHRHRHDYLFVTIGEAHVSNQVAGKPAVELKLSDGETRFAPGNFAHIAQNLADTPFRNVTIEILQDEKLRSAPDIWNELGPERTSPGRQSKILFVKDGVRAREMTLDAGATMPSHHHDHPHLVVAVSAFDLRTSVEGKPAESRSFKPGDIEWIPAGVTHSLTNNGASAAHFIAVDFP